MPSLPSQVPVPVSSYFWASATNSESTSVVSAASRVLLTLSPRLPVRGLAMTANRPGVVMSGLAGLAFGFVEPEFGLSRLTLDFAKFGFALARRLRLNPLSSIVSAERFRFLGLKSRASASSSLRFRLLPPPLPLFSSTPPHYSPAPTPSA